MTQAITITNRQRLGYGYTNTPTRGPHGRLEMPEPAEEVVGGWRQIEARHRDAAARNNGNDWRARLFVDGRRVMNRPDDVFYQLEESGFARLTVEAQ